MIKYYFIPIFSHLFFQDSNDSYIKTFLCVPNVFFFFCIFHRIFSLHFNLDIFCLPDC